MTDSSYQLSKNQPDSSRRSQVIRVSIISVSHTHTQRHMQTLFLIIIFRCFHKNLENKTQWHHETSSMTKQILLYHSVRKWTLYARFTRGKVGFPALVREKNSRKSNLWHGQEKSVLLGLAWTDSARLSREPDFYRSSYENNVYFTKTTKRSR